MSDVDFEWCSGKRLNIRHKDKLLCILTCRKQAPPVERRPCYHRSQVPMACWWQWAVAARQLLGTVARRPTSTTTSRFRCKTGQRPSSRQLPERRSLGTRTVNSAFPGCRVPAGRGCRHYYFRWGQQQALDGRRRWSELQSPTSWGSAATIQAVDAGPRPSV